MDSIKKNIVINDYGGYSFIYELAKEISLEYNVYFIYASVSGSSKGNVYEDSQNLKCINLIDKTIDKSNFIKRLFIEIAYGNNFKRFLASNKIDVVLSANTPVIPQYIIQRYCRKNKIKFIFWLQDIISLAVKSVLEKKSKIISGLFYNLWKYFEKSALQNADKIIVITKDFENFLSTWNVNKNKIDYIPNWSSLKDIVPTSKENSFSKKYNLTTSFNVLYSGTLGYKHNPEIFFTLAKRLLNHNIKIIVISEGIGMNYLKNILRDHPLENLLLLPYQSKSSLSEVYGSADIILSILEKTAGIFSVPSKVWATYCAGKPSVLIVPKENQAAKITADIKAGIIIEPDRAEDLVEKLLELKTNPELLNSYGINARKYAEENFDIKKISQKFLKLINS